MVKGGGKAGEEAPLGKLEEGFRAPPACPSTSASDSLQGQVKIDTHMSTWEDKLWIRGRGTAGRV